MRKVSKSYNIGGTDIRVLEDVDLVVSEGEFITIMGASGSGKSTLLNLIGCLDRPTQGAYRFKGQVVEALSDMALSRLRSREIGFIFQSFNLLPRMSVVRNIELPLVYQKTKKRQRLAIAQKLLDRLGLEGKGLRRPTELSGGEQQRVAIARALASQPSLLLADEPTGNLDSETGTEIMKILSGLQKEGLTIIMVTHAHEMKHYADRTVYMKDGRLTTTVNRNTA